MRLFIALELDDAVKDRLQEMQAVLRQARSRREDAGRLSFPLREHLHLTLVFLGEVPPARLDDVRAVLAEVRLDPTLSGPLRLRVEGVGSFPQREGRVWWVGVREDPGLAALQRRLSEGLAARGFDPDRRPYRPHLTIAREEGGTPGPLPKGSATVPELHFPCLETTPVRTTLFESTRLQGRLLHSRID